LEHETNTLGQPVGAPVPDWTPRNLPPREKLAGRFCRVEPLDASRHAQSLYEAGQLDRDGASWTYLAYGPFATFSHYREWAAASQMSQDPLFFAIIDQATDAAVGIASYLRIDPKNGVIEIGHLHFSPLLQRTPAATEALFLLMDQAFQLGYRRLEWKCHALNAASRRAAQRLGLTFEGIFRQATVVKGRNRDTAWYSAIDGEWPALRQAFVRWLDPGNFRLDGTQIEALSALTSPLLKDFR
jgi:RimJ/RimL family protein N-acetyltransferase